MANSRLYYSFVWAFGIAGILMLFYKNYSIGFVFLLLGIVLVLFAKDFGVA